MTNRTIRNLEYKELSSKLSTSFITHFTTEFKVLLQILENGFKPSIPKEGENNLGKVEYYELIASDNFLNHQNLNSCENEICTKSYVEKNFMVSFCDIPFEKSKTHTENYGKYGISLTKTWALNNFINPVNYIFRNSPNHQSLYSLNNQFEILNKEVYELGICFKRFNLFNLKNTIDEINKMSREYYNFDKKTKYYDEREWRRIFHQIEPKDIENFHLRFEPKDIKHIIVSEINEIQTILDFGKQKWNIDLVKKIRILK